MTNPFISFLHALLENDNFLDEIIVSGYSVIMESEDPNIRYVDSTVNSHHGQLDCILNAFIGETRVGYVDYDIYDNKITINLVTVDENYRRKGIARGMILELQRTHPDYYINWDYRTQQGEALYQSLKHELKQYDDTDEGKELINARNRYKELKALEKKLETEFEKLTSKDESDAFLEKYGDSWNQLHDQIGDLEREYSYRLYIKEADGIIHKSVPIDDIN